MKENNTYLDEICLNMLRFLSIKNYSTFLIC